jgi:N-dimethylarginine dimethylaminohydrolase
MGYPTSAATAYSTDDKARDMQKLVPCTQSVKVSSKGTVRFTPTYPGTPKNVILNAKNATAAAIMAASTFRIVTLSSNQIAFSGGTTNTKVGSAYATVFFS